MSVEVGSATAYLFLDKTKYSKDLGSASSEMDSFQKKADSASSGLKSFGGAMSGFGTKLTAGVTVPLVGVGALVAKTVSEFDSNMSNVKALLGSTTTQTAQLRSEAIKLGADTSFSASQAADGMANLASAGFDTNEVIAAMPGMLSLAAASQTDLATASEITASAVNGFGLAAKDSSKVADIFAKAAADSNAGVVDTGEAMKYVAPVAHSYNLTLSEVTGAIEEMANAGIKGSQAGTTLRGAFAKLAKPSDAAADAMQRMGFNAFDAAGNMKHLPQMIGDLQKGLQGMTQEQKANALTTIFGQESLSGMLVLVDQGPDKLAALTKGLENSKGAADEMAKIQLDNVKGDFEQLSGSVETLAINTGEILVPAARKLMQAATGLVNKFNGLDQSSKELVIKAAGMAAAFGPALLVFGKLTEGAGGAVGALGSISGVMSKFSGDSVKGIETAGKNIGGFMSQLSNLGGVKAFGGGMDTLKGKISSFTSGSVLDFKTMKTSVGGAISEIGVNVTSKLPEGLRNGLIGVTQVVSTETPKLKGVFSTVGSGVVDGVKGLMGMALKVIAPAAIIATLTVGLGVAYQQFGPQIDSMIQSVAEKGPTLITNFAAGIVSKIPDLMAAGTQMITGIVTAITVNLPAIIKAAADIIASLVNGLVSNIPTLLPVVFTLIMTLANAIVTNLPTIIKAGLNLLLALANGFANNSDKMIDKIVDLVLNIATTLIKNLPMILEIGIKIIVALIQGVAKMAPELIAKFPEIIKSIWSAFTSINWGDLGWAIIDGIKDGVTAAASGLVNSVKNAASAALNGVKGMLGIHSPSTVFRDQVGYNIVAGISEGIKAAKSLVTSSLVDISDTITMQPELGIVSSGNESDYKKNSKVVDNEKTSSGGDTFNFYTSKPIDEVEAARLVEKKKRELAEGF